MMLSWLKIVGFAALSFVIIAFVLKKAGVIDSIWGVISKFFDWTLSVFMTIVFAAPAPIKIGIFLVLFSMLGAFVVPLTFGVYGQCDSAGTLYVTDSLFEGMSASMLPSGELQRGGSSPYSAEEVSLTGLLTRDGALVSRDDLSYGSVIAVGNLNGGVGDERDSNLYAVCYDTRTGLCSVQRPNRFLRKGGSGRISCTSELGDVEGLNSVVTLLTYNYVVKNVGVENEGLEGAFSKYSVSIGYTNSFSGSLPGGGLTGDFRSISSCPQTPFEGAEFVNITTSGELGTFTSDVLLGLITFGILRDVTDAIDALRSHTYSGYVIGVRAEGVADSDDVNDNRFSAVRLHDEFLVREGSRFNLTSEDSQTTLIQYSCKEGKKDVTLYGLPVFDMQFMLLFTVVIVLGMFIWGRR